VDQLAWQWASAVADTSYVELTGPRLHLFLTDLAERLTEALTGEPFRDDAGGQVGAALVRANLTSVIALQRSVAVLAKLPAALGRPDPETAERMGRLLGTVSAGFATALQDRTLSDQERIRLAALGAREESEQARRDSEARLRAVFGAAGVAIAVGDLRGRLVEANPALAAMFGIPVTELPGRDIFDFIHPDDVPDVQDQVYGQLAAGHGDRVQVEKRFVRADGQVGWTMLTVSLVRAADGSPAYLVAMGEDVTDRHQLADRLHHQAHHDPLTGLPNRALLQQRLAEVFAQAGLTCRIGVCFLDLDEFKAINDTLGHGIGDRLLVDVAERLQRCVSAAGHFIARVGGDEFVVVVPGTDGPAAVVTLAEAMLATLATPVWVQGHDLRVSASVGVVEQRIHDGDPEQILRDADATMYWAKADGRGRWALFDPDRNARQLLRYSLAADLPGAIEDGQFRVEYQPLVSLRDGRLHGAEALLRWQHPRLGTVGPNTFVPLAEQSGLIVPLGRHVLREACRHAAQWQRSGENLPFISVNVSPRQCTEPGLIDDVIEALDDTGLSPGNLQLELTETAVMGSLDRLVTTLQALADLGVRIAIDDFGIGYSNLAHLRHLPVHGLKLAGAFMAGIRAVATDPLDEQIVATVVSLAHAFGMSVTAEGIETADQAARLRALDCDLGQGWHFGRPGAPESIGRRAAQPAPSALA
jgi:diguanylate cyclase (GGDEF)-like protein/PAS domain S-box-containing protein